MRLRQIVQEALRIWSNERPTQLAAGLAYYGMISLGPLLYVFTTVAVFVLGKSDVGEQLSRRIEDTLGPQQAEFFISVIDSGGATVLGDTPLLTIAGIVILLYGASGLFSELRFALNRVWQVPRTAQVGARNFVKQRSLALLMLVGISFLLVLFMQVNTLSEDLITDLRADLPIRVVNETVLFILLTLSLALVFKFIPASQVWWRDVWLGSAITALLILLGMWLILAFARGTKMDSVFELASFVVLILTGIYYISLIVIVGAVICRASAATFGSRADQSDTQAELS